MPERYSTCSRQFVRDTPRGVTAKSVFKTEVFGSRVKMQSCSICHLLPTITRGE